MNKDWTGNPAAPFATLGASNHSSVIREEHDFYATDPSALLLLSRHHDLPLHIWEPCCGTGHLVSVLESLGREVCSTDLVDRGFGRGGVDFFQQTSLMGGGEDENYGILTNPPYRYATEFVRHALALLREGQQLILLLKTTFLEGQKRYESIFKNTPPPNCVSAR